MLQLKPPLESPALTFVVLSLLFCSFYSLRTLCRALRYASGNPHGNALRSIYEVVLGFIHLHSLAFTCIHLHSLTLTHIHLHSLTFTCIQTNETQRNVCFNHVTPMYVWASKCGQGAGLFHSKPALIPTVQTNSNQKCFAMFFFSEEGLLLIPSYPFFPGLLLEFPDPVRQVFTSLSENSDQTAHSGSCQRHRTPESTPPQTTGLWRVQAVWRILGHDRRQRASGFIWLCANSIC